MSLRANLRKRRQEKTQQTSASEDSEEEEEEAVELMEYSEVENSDSEEEEEEEAEDKPKRGRGGRRRTEPEPEPKPATSRRRGKSEPETSVAKAGTTTLSKERVMPAGMSGEWDSDDTEIPRLHIVQMIGDLAKEFDYCSVVYDKAHVLAEPGDSLDMVVLAARKYWQENKSFGDGTDMPNTFDTYQEAMDQGFRKGFTKDDGTVAPAADLDVLVFIDDKIAKGIPGAMEFNGMACVLARFTCASTKYPTTAKRLGTQVARGVLQGRQLHEAIWELSVFDKVDGKLSYAVPSMKNPALIEHEEGFKGFTTWVEEEGLGASA